MSCYQYTDCSSCSAASTCHWCADGSCHLYGTGCIYGENCTVLEKCLRNDPEVYAVRDIPYGEMFAITLAGILISATMTSVLIACYELDLWFKVKSTFNRIFRWIRSFVSFNRGPLLNIETDQYIEMDAWNDSWKHPEDDYSDTSTTSSTILDPKIIHSRIALSCGFLGLIGILMAVIYILIKPPMPEYTLCNSRFLSESVISGLIKGKIKGDFELFLSVWNPALVTVTVHEPSFELYYHDTMIGLMEDLPNNITTPSGTIVDRVLTLTILPNIKLLINMMLKRDHLILEGRFGGNIEVLYGQFSIWKKRYYAVKNFNARSPVQSEKALCLCDNM